MVAAGVPAGPMFGPCFAIWVISTSLESMDVFSSGSRATLLI